MRTEVAVICRVSARIGVEALRARAAPAGQVGEPGTQAAFPEPARVGKGPAGPEPVPPVCTAALGSREEQRAWVCATKGLSRCRS